MEAAQPTVDPREPDGTAEVPGPDATARLWRLRSPRSAAIPSVVALTGVDARRLAEVTAVAVAASREAGILLDGMETRIRTLPTAATTEVERCSGSVRGPILWSETITARAHALGNEDLFVCMTTGRTFDRIENQLLVDALDAITAATRALDGPAAEGLGEEEIDRVRAVAAEAAGWRADARLADVRPARLNGRAAARVRGGHRRTSMGPVLAVRHRAREPFGSEQVSAMADEWTRRLHALVERVLAAMELPPVLTLSDGGLWSRSLSFRHPAAPGPGTSGLAVRGVALLGPVEETEGAPWAPLVPEEGIRIPTGAAPEEIRALLTRNLRR